MRSRALFLVIVTTAVTLLAAAALAEDAEAAHRDVWGVLVVSGGTVLYSGDTIDVRGNVIVRNGGTLRLENCTLSINATTDGGRGLDVSSTGRLLAFDTVIEGNDRRVTIEISNDALLERCTVRHLYGSYTGGITGFLLNGGYTVVRDTVIRDTNYYGVVPRTDCLLDNCTIQETEYAAVHASNYGPGADAPYTVTINGGRFIGDGTSGWYKHALYATPYSSAPKVTVVMRGTRCEGWESGVYIYGSSRLEATVEDCELFNNRVGANINMSGASVTFRNNVVGHKATSPNVGIQVQAAVGQDLTMEGNVVEDTGRGYVFNSPWSGSGDRSWGHLVVRNCTEGIVVTRQYGSNPTVTIHNSTLQNIGSSYGCFVAEGGAGIVIFDTVHTPGSGRVTDNSWIRAYTVVEILSTKWQNGPPITEGALILENVTDVEVARFNLSLLRPQSVLAWEVDSNGRRADRFLYPAVYVAGHGFHGASFNIWDVPPIRVRIEIVDDSSPDVTVTSPIDGSAYNVTSIAAEGTYSELGSGMAFMQYSFDGAELRNITSFYGGIWTVPLVGLANGEHSLTIRAVDRTANVGETATVAFVVDTLRPFIEIPDPPALVNTTSVIVTGTVEPLSQLTIGPKGYPLDENGTFSADVPLLEGTNVIPVRVVDRARNTNSTTLTVVRDTIAPTLKLTSPEDGTWTNALSTYVEGLTDPGVELRINGQSAQEVSGEIRHRLDLAPGQFVVRVTATDDAGNVAVRSLTMFVDWTTPSLVIVTPEDTYVVTKEREVYLTGDVDDPTIDRVTVNGNPVELTAGRFVKSYTLTEGTNEYIVSVVDRAGNRNTTTIMVVRDLTPPTYTVDLVAVGGKLIQYGGQLYSTAPAVELHVILDELCIIRVPGEDPMEPTKDTRIRFDLGEGINDISIIVTDRAGNEAPSYSMRVVVDTLPPPIIVFEPTPGLRTKEASVVLHGRTDANCNLTVRGSPVNLLPGGEFRLIVALEDGANDIAIHSVDAMGNANDTTVSVVKEGAVKTQDDGGVSALVAVGGFVAGLIIGLVVAFVMLSRRYASEREMATCKGSAARPTSSEKADERPGEEGKPPREGRPPGRSGWEEF